MNARARQAGFTLLEVVVAFVVLALVLGTVMQIFSSGLARAGDLEEYSAAMNVAQTKLAAAGVEEAVREGEIRGATPDRRFEWALKISRHQELPGSSGTTAAAAAAPAAGTFALYRVESNVTWRAPDGRQRHVTLATLTLGPPNP